MSSQWNPYPHPSKSTCHLGVAGGPYAIGTSGFLAGEMFPALIMWPSHRFCWCDFMWFEYMTTCAFVLEKKCGSPCIVLLHPFMFTSTWPRHLAREAAPLGLGLWAARGGSKGTWVGPACGTRAWRSKRSAGARRGNRAAEKIEGAESDG